VGDHLLERLGARVGAAALEGNGTPTPTVPEMA
jgi:hypothetical protein